jgi:hypothetical protein
MAKGLEIVVTSNPKGVFIGIIVSGTPKPGTKMTIKAGVAPVGGRHTWEAYNPTSDADPRLIAILDKDYLQGKEATDAYVSGTRAQVYCPLPGEDMNVLVEGEAGTGSANVFTVGERLRAVHATGKYKAETNSAAYADFVVLEKTTEVADVDTLVWVLRQ